MEKDKLIRVFKFENLLLGIVVSIIVVTMIVIGTKSIHHAMGVGMFVGVWIGVLFNHFVQIPSMYGKKDERELILKIISMYLSVSFAFVISFILFALTVFSVIYFTLAEFSAIIIIILGITLGIRWLSYKLLLRYL
ncbi:MAG: hypothetical protein CVV02_14620 [Firmicutes bacterium HGW-Firmicutes-7]|nr:MAG: hypothetical protein CVV02_14620 [Firmicutes bacterium HGW-Firmicutes-7]